VLRPRTDGVPDLGVATGAGSPRVEPCIEGAPVLLVGISIIPEECD